MTRWLPVALAMLAVACKPRPDPYAVVPLVPRDTTADAGTAPRARRDAGVIRFQHMDGGVPAEVLGVTFGTTRAALLLRNRTAAVPCRESAEYVFCERALVPVPLARVVVSYEFCGDSLCSVALDGTRTRDEAMMVREFDALAAMLQTRLGAPSIQVRRAGSGCSGHLPLCLTSRQAEYSARWSWRDGPQVSLSVDALEDDALVAQVALAWLARERVTWDAGPPPPHPLLATRDAGAPDAP